MSSLPTSPPHPFPTTTAPQTGSASDPSQGPPAGLSVSLATGLVLCPIAFLLLVVGFWRVARKGDLFTRLPTARLQAQERRRRVDFSKFIGRSSFFFGAISNPSINADGMGARRSSSPPLPLYTLPIPPPPVYTPPSSALPSYDLANRQPEV